MLSSHFTFCFTIEVKSWRLAQQAIANEIWRTDKSVEGNRAVEEEWEESAEIRHGRQGGRN
jgi:hypothetical protein